MGKSWQGRYLRLTPLCSSQSYVFKDSVFCNERM